MLDLHIQIHQAHHLTKERNKAMAEDKKTNNINSTIEKGKSDVLGSVSGAKKMKPVLKKTTQKQQKKK